MGICVGTTRSHMCHFSVSDCCMSGSLGRLQLSVPLLPTCTAEYVQHHGLKNHHFFVSSSCSGKSAANPAQVPDHLSGATLGHGIIICQLC